MKFLSKNKWTLLFLGFGGILLGICNLLDFDGLYGQDAYAYLAYSKKLKSFFFGGEHPGAFNWPLGYSFATASISFILNDVMQSAQFVSILSHTLICIIGGKFIRLLYTDVSQTTIGIYVLCFIGFSPYLVRFGVTAMSEALCGLMIITCFYQYYRYQVFEKVHALFYCILFGAIAVTVRNASIVLVLIPTVLAGYKLLRYKKWIHLLLGILCASALATTTFFTKTTQFAGDGMVFSDLFNLSNFITLSGTGSQGAVEVSVPNVIYAFYGFFFPAFMFTGGLFIILMFIKKPKIQWMMLISLIIYSLFIASIYFQNKRFLVIQVPVIGVLLFAGFLELKKLLDRRKMYLIFMITAFIINVGLTLYTCGKAYSFQQLEKNIATEIIEYEGNKLYTFWLNSALEGRGLDFEYENLWNTQENTFTKDALVLFNEQKFVKQWEGFPLMKKWNELKRNHKLTVLKTMEDGWVIYRMD